MRSTTSSQGRVHENMLRREQIKMQRELYKMATLLHKEQQFLQLLNPQQPEPSTAPLTQPESTQRSQLGTRHVTEHLENDDTELSVDVDVVNHLNQDS